MKYNELTGEFERETDEMAACVLAGLIRGCLKLVLLAAPPTLVFMAVRFMWRCFI